MWSYAPVSAFTRVFDALWAVHRGAWTQNRENNPMQSRMGAGTRAALRPGHEKKNGRRHDPNPISSRSKPLKRARFLTFLLKRRPSALAPPRAGWDNLPAGH